MLPDEYVAWLKGLPAPTRPPTPAANTDEEKCRSVGLVRVPAGDFETEYSSKIPSHEFKTAIRSVQRGVQVAPYCPWTKATSLLRWRRMGQSLLAYWVCPRCSDLGWGAWYDGA